MFKDRVAERLGPTVAEQPREDVGSSFATVGWIGGGTGSGKTTVARALAARHGLRMFPLEAFELTSRRRMRLAMEDLAQMHERPSTLVEGPQVLPDLLPRGAPAVFLHPTKEFQRSVLGRRAPPPTANPRLALEKRIKKDQLYAGRVASLAAERGFAVLTVDGSRSPEVILATVERSLASFLDASRGPVDLQPTRRWENAGARGRRQRQNGRDRLGAVGLADWSSPRRTPRRGAQEDVARRGSGSPPAGRAMLTGRGDT